jgi:predicted membrane protein
MEKLFAITLLTLISVVEIIFMLLGKMLPTAAVLIALILLLVFLMVFRLDSRHFWKLIALIFLINLLMVCYLFLKLGWEWPLLLVLFMILAGLLFSAASLRKRARRLAGFRTISTKPSLPSEKNPESHAASLIESYIQALDEKSTTKKLKDAPEKPHTVVRKSFSPGRFVASRLGRQYHKPRCDWAKNIRKENRLWFATAEEAEKKGYTRHTCLKK